MLYSLTAAYLPTSYRLASFHIPFLGGDASAQVEKVKLGNPAVELVVYGFRKIVLRDVKIKVMSGNTTQSRGSMILAASHLRCELGRLLNPVRPNP